MHSKKKPDDSTSKRRIIFAILFLPLFFSSFDSAAQLMQTPQWDSISITSNHHPILSWFPNTDNTVGYVIIRRDWNGSTFIWHDIDTVVGITQTHYIDQKVNACDSSRWYRLFAYGQGTNNNSLWSDTLRTIYLAPPEWNVCESTVFLQWSSYMHMIPDLAGYRILASESGGPFFEIASVGPAETSYTLRQNLQQNTLYSFRVRAFNGGSSRTSSSCAVTLETHTPQQPDSVYIRYVTVENNDHIKLEWVANTTAPISKYKILRSVDKMTWDNIGDLTDLTGYDPDKEFIDATADFQIQSYYYQIRTCDSCGVDTLASDNIARTIQLTGFPTLTGDENMLKWNEYEGWKNTGVEEYKIYRSVDNGSWTEIDQVSPGTTFYTDDVSGFTGNLGTFRYYVEAFENDGSSGFENFKDQSRSNEITIEQETRVIIPNAFTPGKPPNDLFKPLLAFIDVNGYSFSIYNKWGQMIFSTDDPSEGWDGTYKGEYVPTDAYVYLIVYRTPEGQTIEKRGTVTVVR